MLFDLNTLVSETVVIRGGGVGKLGRYWSEGTKWKLRRMNKSRARMYGILTTVDNSVLNTEH